MNKELNTRAIELALDCGAERVGNWHSPLALLEKDWPAFYNVAFLDGMRKAAEIAEREKYRAALAGEDIQVESAILARIAELETQK